VLRRLYARLVNGKTACRRHLFPENVPIDGSQVSLPATCPGHVCPWLCVELQRCSWCGPGWLPREGLVIVCPLPTKKTRESLDSSSGSSVKKCTTFDSFPELWAFLTCYLSPDGDKRQGGKLSLSCEQGMWSLVLTDPHTSLYACLNGPDLDDLVLMAEARLAESTMPWRPSNYTPKGRR